MALFSILHLTEHTLIVMNINHVNLFLIYFQRAYTAVNKENLMNIARLLDEGIQRHGTYEQLTYLGEKRKVILSNAEIRRNASALASGIRTAADNELRGASVTDRFPCRITAPGSHLG